MASAPRKGLPAPERRQTRLDTAWALLAEGGPKLVTIDAVVEHLGISRPIFYRHFRDRVALLVALYHQYAEAALIDAAGGDPRMEATRAQLRERLFGLWQRAVIRRLSPELAAVAVGDDEVRVALELSLELVQALANDAATIWLSGRATRQQVQHALLVMMGGLTRRFLDDLVATGHLDPEQLGPGLI